MTEIEKLEAYDHPLLILGGGPAGLTAALYARRAGLPATVWEGQPMPGGQMATTPEIENVPGIARTDGFFLSETMAEQVKQLGAVIELRRVTGLSLQPSALRVQSDELSVTAEAIILAMGARRRRLEIPGEDRLAGRGVSYCAVCDGHFFRGKPVAVVGGGNAALEDSLHLANLGCSVTLLHRKNEFRAVPRLQERVNAEPRIAVMKPWLPLAIEGEASVTGLRIKHAATGAEGTLAVSAVFVCIGTVANTDRVRDWLTLDGEGRIIAGEDTETDIPGVYASGDIRQKPLYQIITAAADGAVAATRAAEFLAKGLGS